MTTNEIIRDCQKALNPVMVIFFTDKTFKIMDGAKVIARAQVSLSLIEALQATGTLIKVVGNKLSTTYQWKKNQ